MAARVRWQVRVEPGLLWIMLLLLLVLVSGLFYSHQQCQGLSGLRLEIKRELDELTRLKAELERGLSEWNTSTSRAKRQVKSSGGNGLFTKRKSRAGSSSSKGKKSKTKPAVQDHQGTHQVLHIPSVSCVFLNPIKPLDTLLQLLRLFETVLA